MSYKIPTRINTNTTTDLSSHTILHNIFCASSSSGTISITDGAGNVLIGQFDAVAGQNYVFEFLANGIIVVTTGTIDITVVTED